MWYLILASLAFTLLATWLVMPHITALQSADRSLQVQRPRSKRRDRPRSAAVGRSPGLVQPVIPSFFNASCGELRLDKVFTPGVVLQHDKPCVSGSANTGVVVVHGGTAVAGQPGPGECRFTVCLPPQPPTSDPQTVLVLGARRNKTLVNVWFGDVFYCFGQSNMRHPLADQGASPFDQQKFLFKARLAQLLRDLGDPLIRLHNGEAVLWVETRTQDVARMRGFSAPCFFMGVHLYNATNSRIARPLGLVTRSVVGTPIVSFLSPKFYALSTTRCPRPRCQTAIPGTCNVYRRRPQPGLQEPRNSPSLAYARGVLRDVEGLSLKAFVYYQGESDVMGSNAYHCRHEILLWQIRSNPLWGPAAPYIYTLIAGMPGKTLGGRTPMVREQQLMLPFFADHTALAPAHDLGHPLDVHPPDSREVGRRLGLAVRASVYGEAVAYQGPALVQVNMTTEGPLAVQAFFDGPGAPFVLNGTRDCVECCALSPFELQVAGKWQRTVPAALEPLTHGAEAVVILPAAEAPVRLRFAYEDDPQCMLYNAMWLPALPFDVWLHSGLVQLALRDTLVSSGLWNASLHRNVQSRA